MPRECCIRARGVIAWTPSEQRPGVQTFRKGVTIMVGWGWLGVSAVLRRSGYWLLAVCAIGPSVAQADGTLDRIKETGEIRLAYRADASPFSFELDGKPGGYSVNLCLEVAEALKDDLNLPQLSASFVKVTAENRFDAVAKGAIDLLCEATSVTLKRRETMDFSIPTFVSGASLVIRPDGPTSMDATGGQARLACWGARRPRRISTPR